MRTTPITAEAGLEAAFSLACQTRGLVSVPAPALDSELGGGRVGGRGSGGQQTPEAQPGMSYLVCSHSTHHKGPRCHFPGYISSWAGALGCSPCLSLSLRDTAGKR